MRDFKIGDIVVCIEPNHHSKGIEGVVTHVHPPKLTVLREDGDSSVHQTWFIHKFEHAYIYNSPLYKALL